MLLASPVARAEDDDTESFYTAGFEDGSWIRHASISNWNHHDREPEIGGRSLFGQEPRVTWLRRHGQPPLPRVETCLEFHGGDLLPGRIVARRVEGGRREAILVVEPHFTFTLPGSRNERELRVRESCVKRITREEGEGAPPTPPGTLRFRDGRVRAFRSLRWVGDEVQLLTESGLETVPADSLLQVHYPARDAWTSYLDTVAALAPGPGERILRLTHESGLRLTASTDRFRATNRGGNQSNPGYWYHLVHPAWSLDPIWLSHPAVIERVYFEPERPPLTLFAPDRVEYRQALGARFPWRLDRSVLGTTLATQERDFGWGFGVHAHTELAFDLPDLVTGFRSRVALDRRAGEGGCVRAGIRDARGHVLHEGELLIGSSTHREVDWIALPDRAGGRSLVLVADAALEDHPPEADPLDIRDHLDWLEPRLRLDPARLRAELGRRATHSMAAWAGWKVEGAGGFAFERTNTLESAGNDRQRILQPVTAQPPFLRLSRSVRVTDESARLEILAGLPPGTYEAIHLEVRVNSEEPVLLKVGRWSTWQPPEPLVVSLGEHVGEQVTIQITQVASGPKSRVHWEDLALQ